MSISDPSAATTAVAAERPLFAARISLIDTENAFKVGPYIAEVEASGTRVIKCNLGEPDFPLPSHIRDEVKRQLDNDLTLNFAQAGMSAIGERIVV